MHRCSRATSPLDADDFIDSRRTDVVRWRSVRQPTLLYRIVVTHVCCYSSTIRIALENTSSSPIDFINLSFTDSLSQSIQAYLTDNELPAVEAYELQAEALQRPVFTWEGTKETSILPGAPHILEVKCLGKIGWYVLSLNRRVGSNSSCRYTSQRIRNDTNRLWTSRPRYRSIEEDFPHTTDLLRRLHYRSSSSHRTHS